MGSLYDVLKTSKMGAGAAPDLFTALFAQQHSGDKIIKLDDDLPYYAYGISDISDYKFVSFRTGRCFLIPCVSNGTYTLSIHDFGSRTLARLGFYDKPQPVADEYIPLLVQAKNEYNPTLTLTNSLNLPYLLFQLDNALYDTYGFDNVELILRR